MSVSRPAALPPGERALGTLWIGGWVDPIAGLDDVEKRKFLNLGRPARSQSLCQLRYLGSVLYYRNCNVIGKFEAVMRFRDLYLNGTIQN
jgi:hypothetical protein